jgi:hypothetical protein
VGQAFVKLLTGQAFALNIRDGGGILMQVYVMAKIAESFRIKELLLLLLNALEGAWRRNILNIWVLHETLPQARDVAASYITLPLPLVEVIFLSMFMFLSMHFCRLRVQSRPFVDSLAEHG